MIPLILFLSGIILSTSRHGGWGAVCFVIAAIALVAVV